MVYALAAAAMTYTITKDCASGAIPDCGCGTHPASTDGTFKWNGCGDNVKWGSKFSRQFTRSEYSSFARNTDGPYSKNDIDDMSPNSNDDMVRGELKALTIINEHNYKIGRKVSNRS